MSTSSQYVSSGNLLSEKCDSCIPIQASGDYEYFVLLHLVQVCDGALWISHVEHMNILHVVIDKNGNTFIMIGYHSERKLCTCMSMCFIDIKFVVAMPTFAKCGQFQTE